MIPLSLSIKNFCSHSFSNFSFEDFDSAVIVGKIRGSDKYSNGAGKSSIFNAIEYALFNETKFSSLDKIIREGESSCSVEFEFRSSLDSETYKIIRSNSISSGSDVRFFRKNDSSWEDITQRRASDTDKEIGKALGFNYKTFCASSVFVQSGSENNTQRDFSNLPSITPEKRKAVLREIIRVSHYSQYEKTAKQKLADLQLAVDKLNLYISTNQEIADEEESVNKSYQELVITSQSIISDKQKLLEEKCEIERVIQKYKNDNSDLISQLKSLNSEVKSISSQIKTVEDSVIGWQHKVSKYSLVVKEELVAKNDMLSSLSAYKTEINKYPEVNYQELQKLKSSLQEALSKKAVLKSKIKDCELFNISEGNCNHCLQPITNEYRLDVLKKNELIKKTSLQEIENIELELVNISNNISSIESLKKNKDTYLTKYSILEEKIKASDAKIEHNSSSLNEAENMMLASKQNIASLQKELSVKTIHFNKLNNEYKNLQNSSRIKEFDLKFKEIVEKIDALEKTLLFVEKEKGVSEHKISNIEKVKAKILADKALKKELDSKIKVMQKVILAFGSSGIPSMIISSALDDLQEYSNSWLSKIRPGLQLQLVVSKNKSNGDIDDTMDIVYFVDGSEREYKQLSGAQKIVISFAIKLGILEVINKRMGVSIKLLLLDEVDQSLDEGGLETFGEIVKKIQNDYKVLIITHNNYLKNKFANFITVEQDDNNVSTAKLSKI